MGMIRAIFFVLVIATIIGFSYKYLVAHPWTRSVVFRWVTFGAAMLVLALIVVFTIVALF